MIVIDIIMIDMIVIDIAIIDMMVIHMIIIVRYNNDSDRYNNDIVIVIDITMLG